MLTINKMDRYDLINTPGDDKPAFTIWFSGCSMKCEGCHNPRLQDASNGNKYDSSTILFAICRECEKLNVDTVVLLGGEPMEQNYGDLLILVDDLYRYGYKVWLYTGWEFDQIPNNLKLHLYTIKCGKYDQSLKQDGFPSSSNQKVYRNFGDKWEEITL